MTKSYTVLQTASTDTSPAPASSSTRSSPHVVTLSPPSTAAAIRRRSSSNVKPVTPPITNAFIHLEIENGDEGAGLDNVDLSRPLPGISDDESKISDDESKNSSDGGRIKIDNRESALRFVPKIIQEQLQDYIHVLHTFPMYKYYLLSHICQHAGDWFVRIASLLIVQELSTKGAALANLTLAVKLPMVIFAQVGGYLADRYDRRVLMISMDLLSGIIVLGFLIAIQYKSLPMMYTVTALRSAIGAAYYPVTLGIVPMLVPNKHDLQYAVTMNSYAWSFMAVLGGVVAGSLTAVIGLKACYVLDFVTFIVSAAVVYFGISGNYNARNTNGTATVDIAAHEDLSFIGRKCNAVKQVFTYLSTCGFGLLVMMKPTASLIWGIEDIVGALFATIRDASGEEIEGKSSFRTGVLFSVIGAGCAVGMALINLITDANKPITLQRASIIGCGGITFGWILISLAPNYSWFLAFTFIRVMGSGVAWTFSTMTLQSMVPSDILGRVLSVEFTLYTLAEAASATVTGKLDDAGISRNMLALFGASLGIVTVSLWSIYHWLLRRGAASEKFNQTKESTGRHTSLDISTLTVEHDLDETGGVMA